MLQALEHGEPVPVPLDNTRTWYRYHHLFAELLRRELRARHAATKPSCTSGPPAGWPPRGSSTRRSPTPSPPKHGTWRSSSAPRTGSTLVVQGRSSTLRHLYGAPPDELRKRPEAALGFAWLAMLTGDLDSARCWLDIAEASMTDARRPADRRRAPARRPRRSTWAISPPTRRTSPHVLSLLATTPRSSASTVTPATGGRSCSGPGTRSGPRSTPTERAHRRRVAAFREHRPARGVIEAAGSRALLTLWDGRPDDARRDADEALDLEAERQPGRQLARRVGAPGPRRASPGAARAGRRRDSPGPCARVVRAPSGRQRA